MVKIMLARLFQGHRTIKFPAAPAPALPDRYQGRPEIDSAFCSADCSACAASCPTAAIACDGTAAQAAPSIDLGKCLFCADCAESCPHGSIRFSSDYRLATRTRDALRLKADDVAIALAGELDKRLKRLFGRSLKLRQVSAGGCNACEADINVLTTVGWDLGRFGIQIVASPRHADGLIVTGPVTKNMELALRKTYDAVGEPKILIAVGACAISGGLFADRPETCGGLPSILPVDLFIPGCPPHPLTILDGLLRLTGRIESRPRGR
jgi:Ni,Fe-hydrogenase III small subunit/formate hydrogenlyase subunit 6/NADH:ubiquinone oxidoreductase subunit I